MKRLIMISILFFISLSAFSANYEVTCYLKDDFDSWNVYIAEDTAQFFDNDSSYDMEFWNISGENWVYSLSDDFQSLTFYFNQRALEGTLMIDYPNSEEPTYEYEMFCDYESNEWL